MSSKNIFFRTLVSYSRSIKSARIVAYHQNYDHHKRRNESSTHIHTKIATALFGSVLIGSTITDNSNIKNKESKTDGRNSKSFEAGEKRPDLPTYRAEEVSTHDNKSSFWVTYKHGVYDVTEFLPSHPGGEQILNAGGYSIEPFWNVYGMHKTEEVYRLLEKYRIGNLHDDDIVDHSGDELWAKEPLRDKRLIVKTAKPFNAEIPPKCQIEHFDTPNELFYVRQHMPVPELEAERHSIKVVVKNGSTKVHHFTLDQLEQFGRVEVRAALMCAGNRRSEMNKVPVEVKAVKGISWAGGAISNAVWSGVYLRDILLHCGVDLRDTRGKHVILAGADVDATGEQFSTSIPLSLAADEGAQVLLATHMNGQPLPPDHGYPLRAIVPGAPAVRSVKWLESVTVSTEESGSHWHQKDYRGFNPSVTWETADFGSAPPVYSLPVTSHACEPADGEAVRVRDGLVRVRGYAFSGGGARVLRVDVSADCGRTWVAASLTATDDAPPRRHYAWTLWEAHLPASPHQDEMEIWVKATDSNFNTQPENFEDIWNIRGLLANAYHKIKIKLIH